MKRTLRLKDRHSFLICERMECLGDDKLFRRAKVYGELALEQSSLAVAQAHEPSPYGMRSTFEVMGEVVLGDGKVEVGVYSHFRL